MAVVSSTRSVNAFPPWPAFAVSDVRETSSRDNRKNVSAGAERAAVSSHHLPLHKVSLCHTKVTLSTDECFPQAISHTPASVWRQGYSEREYTLNLTLYFLRVIMTSPVIHKPLVGREIWCGGGSTTSFNFNVTRVIKVRIMNSFGVYCTTQAWQHRWQRLTALACKHQCSNGC